MRILFITDLHIKISVFGQLEALQTYLEEWHAVYPHTLGAVVIGGDTLDTHEKLCSLSLTRAGAFISFLQTFAPVYILVGNHDYINNTQFCSQNHWLNILKPWGKLTVVDTTMSVRIQGKQIVLVPYVYPGEFKRALDVAVLNWADVCLIFAHQEFRGCKMGSIVSSTGDEWDSDIPVISGHIHEPQQVGSVYYPGSSISHACAHKSIGPCIVTDTGEITHIGFTAQLPTKILDLANPINTAELAQLDPNTKIIIRGSELAIAETLGNPILRQMLVKRKLICDEKTPVDNWESYMLKHISSPAMMDDYVSVAKQCQ